MTGWVGKVWAALRWFGVLAVIFALFLFTTWIVGQCRGPERPAKPIPGHVDAGVPVAPLAPVVTDPGAELPRMALTLAQLRAEAERLGMQVTVPPKAGGKSKPKPPTGSAPTTEEPNEAEVAAADSEFVDSSVYPKKYAEEMFGPGPAGDRINVSAWQLAPRGAVDLRAEWLQYQPPPEVKKRFELLARWRKEFGVGMLANKNGIGYGAFGRLRYEAMRVGAGTIGASAMALGGQVKGETDWTVLVAADLSVD